MILVCMLFHMEDVQFYQFCPNDTANSLKPVVSFAKIHKNTRFIVGKPSSLQTFFQLAVLVDFLVGKTDSLLAGAPHLLGGFQVTDGIGLLIFEDLATGTAGSLWLAIGTPSTNGGSVSVPTPVDTRLGALWVVDDLGETFTGFRFADVSSGDVLHEDREQLKISKQKNKQKNPMVA